jgi:hypothetical protein
MARKVKPSTTSGQIRARFQAAHEDRLRLINKRFPVCHRYGGKSWAGVLITKEDDLILNVTTGNRPHRYQGIYDGWDDPLAVFGQEY